MQPNLQIFEGAEGIKHILSDIILYKNIEAFALWPTKEMIEVLSVDFHEYINRQRIRQNIYTRGLCPRKQAVDIKEYPCFGVGGKFLRDIRLAPADIDCSLGYWSYADKVAFVSTSNELFGYIIQSPEMVTMLKTQYDFIWEKSKPIQPQPKYTDAFLDTC